MYCLTINPKKEVDVMEVSQVEDESNIVTYEALRSMLDALGIGIFEVYPLSLGVHHFQVFLDEEGKLKGLIPNATATYLLDTLPFDIIAGPILVLSDHKDPNTYYLTEDEVNTLKSAILELLGAKYTAP